MLKNCLLNLQQRYAILLVAIGLLSTIFPNPSDAQHLPGSYSQSLSEGRSIRIFTSLGEAFRLTPYGSHCIRIQAVPPGKSFSPDSLLEMVESHDHDGKLLANDMGTGIQFSTGHPEGIRLYLEKSTMRIHVSGPDDTSPFLLSNTGISWHEGSVSWSFLPDTSEHFAGLGHDYFGRVPRLDLRGQKISRNYGKAHYQQAPLLVPFYMSDKGYGVFVNSTAPNQFSFGHQGEYSLTLFQTTEMDVFVIYGPDFKDVLSRYTDLTGKPRLLPKAAFGLALSDKGHDHNSPTPSDEIWWKQKIRDHLSAGFPLDHIVNDNRWRAGGGQRCISRFEWDADRYPEPDKYQQWVRENGLILTLDFNRCIASHSEGWLPSYNISRPDSVDFGDSAPDLTNPAFRTWFWSTFWTQSLNPELGYPGDALWIDEFDEMGKTPGSMILNNGSTWALTRNYWFFLIAKSLVQDGWDRQLRDSKRPFVWVRGMTAGAQRYATLWSGDILPNYEEMKMQIRGMQAAGISGFPFWGHDAGGFFDWSAGKGPDEDLYRHWSMAFGSFSPFWKPHGVGQSRWPLDRSAAAQEVARMYSRLRYQLMPYLYTQAVVASTNGIPIARPLLLDYATFPQAWFYDLQYSWGPSFLVAPVTSEKEPVPVWLPPGTWYDFWSDSLLAGNQEHQVPASDQIPLFVKAGAIIPMASFATSTAFMRDDSLTIHIYTRQDGQFTLIEDDGRTERYRQGERRTTTFSYHQQPVSLTIEGAVGTFQGAATQRIFTLIFHGLPSPISFTMNGIILESHSIGGHGQVLVSLPPVPAEKTITISSIQKK